MSPAGQWSLGAGGLALALAMMVFRANPRHELYRVCAAWGLAVALWNLGASALDVVESAAVAKVWLRVAWTAILFQPVFVLHFLRLSLLGPGGRFQFWYWITAGAAAVLLTSDWLIVGTQADGYGWTARRGDGLTLFLIVVLPVTAFMLLRALWVIAQAWDEIDRKLKLGLVAVGVALGAGQLFGDAQVVATLRARFPFGAETPFHSLGFLTAAAYGILIGFGLVFEEWRDLRIALRRALMALPSLFVLLAVGAALLAGVAWTWPRWMAASGYAVALVGMVLGVLIVLVWGSPGAKRHTLPRPGASPRGGRLAYLEKIAALGTELSRAPELAAGLARVCKELKKNLSTRPGGGALSRWGWYAARYPAARGRDRRGAGSALVSRGRSGALARRG
jgi:hypothetical protein